MTRKLLASTAIATLIATGAYAQMTAPEPADEPVMEMEMEQEQIERAPGHLASNIIGERVYNSVADDAENIGNVNDVVIGTDGNVEYIVVGVGGFLGLGQHDVAIAYEELEWAERDGQWWLVVNTTREALEAQPEFETAAYDPGLGLPPEPEDDDVAEAPADDDLIDDDVAEAPADDDLIDDDVAEAPTDDDLVEDDVAEAPADDDLVEDDVAEAPAEEPDELETGAIDPGTLDTVDTATISADELIGTTVYGADDENVGSIGDVILSEDGEIDAIIVDVGGFLGIAAKEVAIGMDDLEFMTDADGNMYLYTQFTQEELEAQPEYDAATYAEQRDEQRLTIQ
jgi:sporulation protein YlmC with PRC-barrel domain